MKASSDDDRFVDDSLPEGEWDQDGVEPGVDCEEASVPHKAHSGVCAVSEGRRKPSHRS